MLTKSYTNGIKSCKSFSVQHVAGMSECCAVFKEHSEYNIYVRMGGRQGKGRTGCIWRLGFSFVYSHICLATGVFTSAIYCPVNYPGTEQKPQLFSYEPALALVAKVLSVIFQ